MLKLLDRLRAFVRSLSVVQSKASIAGFEPLESRQMLSLTIDVRLPGGGKAVEISRVGQQINMEVWATVRGADTKATNDGFQTAMGSFLSTIVSDTGASVGTLSLSLMPPFDAFTSQTGKIQDLNGDGSFDVGSNNNDTSDDFAVFRDASMNRTGEISGLNNSFHIGDLAYTVTALRSGQTSINFRPRNQHAGLWMEDGAPMTYETPGMVYLVGKPVVLSYFGTPRIYRSPKGWLQVSGTSADDNIRIGISNGRLVATVNKTSRSFKISSIRKISVWGLAGNDNISVGKGVMAATLDGGPGNDTVKGGNGNDVIYGSDGRNALYGGAGNDTFHARDGAKDTLDGGTGTNRAKVDPSDKRTRIQQLLK